MPRPAQPPPAVPLIVVDSDAAAGATRALTVAAASVWVGTGDDPALAEFRAELGRGRDLRGA